MTSEGVRLSRVEPNTHLKLMCRVFTKRASDIIILRYLSFVLSGQEVKSAILEDMMRLGKEGGLKSFEQVHLLIIKDISNL